MLSALSIFPSNSSQMCASHAIPLKYLPREITWKELGQFEQNLMDSITLRPVRPDDEPYLLSLYADSRRKERRFTTWDDQEWDEFMMFQFVAQNNDYHSRYPDSEYHIIKAGKVKAGRIWVAELEDEIRLIEITIHSSFQNNQIGTHLIEQLQERARNANKALRHMVFAENLPAIRFYERLGFKFVFQQEMYHMMEWNPPESQIKHKY